MVSKRKPKYLHKSPSSFCLRGPSISGSANKKLEIELTKLKNQLSLATPANVSINSNFINLRDSARALFPCCSIVMCPLFENEQINFSTEISLYASCDYIDVENLTLNQNSTAQNLENDRAIDIESPKSEKPTHSGCFQVSSSVLTNILTILNSCNTIQQESILQIDKMKYPMASFHFNQIGTRMILQVLPTSVVQKIRNTSHFNFDGNISTRMHTLVYYFLQKRNLTSVLTGGISPYSLLLMIKHFMKIHPVVQGCRLKMTRNIGMLLLDFFEYYSAFPFHSSQINLSKNLYEKKRYQDYLFVMRDAKNNHIYGDECRMMYEIGEFFNFASKIMTLALQEDFRPNLMISSLWSG